MIRKVKLSDFDELGMLHVHSWQEAYKGLLAKELLDSLSIRDRANHWKTIIVQGDSDVLVDVVDNKIAGFISTSNCRDSDAGSNWAEVFSIYYLKEYWGKGHAEALLKKAFDNLVEAGFTKASLWVLEGNDRAIKFYQKHGFEFDAKKKLEKFYGYEVVELRMVKKL